MRIHRAAIILSLLSIWSTVDAYASITLDVHAEYCLEWNDQFSVYAELTSIITYSDAAYYDIAAIQGYIFDVTSYPPTMVDYGNCFLLQAWATDGHTYYCEFWVKLVLYFFDEYYWCYWDCSGYTEYPFTSFEAYNCWYYLYPVFREGQEMEWAEGHDTATVPPRIISDVVTRPIAGGVLVATERPDQDGFINLGSIIWRGESLTHNYLIGFLWVSSLPLNATAHPNDTARYILSDAHTQGWLTGTDVTTLFQNDKNGNLPESPHFCNDPTKIYAYYAKVMEGTGYCFRGTNLAAIADNGNGRTLAHEFGHSGNLVDVSISDNLMKSDGSLTKLTLSQTETAYNYFKNRLNK